MNGIRPKLASQAGVGMIEILVTMVVIAIGVLSISRMQVATLRTNQSALFRSHASILAYDMIDRLRVDRETALLGSYDLALGDDAPGTSTVPDAEVSAWLAALQAFLPGGDGSIARNGDTLVVTVQWDDTRGNGGPLTFTTAVEL